MSFCSGPALLVFKLASYQTELFLFLFFLFLDDADIFFLLNWVIMLEFMVIPIKGNGGGKSAK